jgi:hypothetical protein
MARSTHTKIENAIATTTPLTRHQLICIAPSGGKKQRNFARHLRARQPRKLAIASISARRDQGFADVLLNGFQGCVRKIEAPAAQLLAGSVGAFCHAAGQLPGSFGEIV